MSDPSAAAAAASASALRSIGLKIASIGFFALMGAGVKWSGERFPVGEIVFFRSFFALIPVFAMVAMEGGPRLLLTRRLGGHLMRSGFGVAAMVTSFWALTLLPLATRTAFNFTTPLFITILSIPLLGEVVRAWRWSAIAIGFAGVLLMVQPGPEGVSFGGVLALASAGFSALAMISIRRMSDTEPSVTIVFYFTLVCTLVGLSSAAIEWVWPTRWQDAAILISTGLLGGIGQILMTQAYRGAPASTIAPFDYSEMIFALALGWALWGEVPDAIVLMGAAIVIASGLVILWREHRLGLERKRIREASPGA